MLANKVCVITGGAGSIGRASAKRFIDEGASVMLVDISNTTLADAAKGLDPKHVATMTADVSRSADVQAYVAKTVAHFGKIDVLFSNAGNLGAIKPISDYPEDVFDQVLAVHVRGAFLACKYALPQMNDGGSIIITSSIVGLKGDPGPYGYITAKHAQVGLMRSVAKEVAARRIRVNTLHPGPIDNSFQAAVEAELSRVIGTNATDFLNTQIPLGRHGTPEEIAESALFLASDRSSFITGTTFRVDGGMGG